MTLRLTAIVGTCAILAACTGVPASNPGAAPVAPDTPATASTPPVEPNALDDLERLSDVTLADNGTAQDAPVLALAAAPQNANDGLFGGGLRSILSAIPASAGTSSSAVRTGPDKQVIPFGQTVAYGEIATVCDVPSGGLGTLIADVSGYKIYDSIPNSTALRPHYITGFDDDCARQFSAALSLTGDVGTHEVVRYLPGNSSMPYTGTDTAYEAIKASFCRVGHGSPCGARLDSMAKHTTFITAYEAFGTRSRWVEILLHDGRVSAIDFKAR